MLTLLIPQLTMPLFPLREIRFTGQSDTWQNSHAKATATAAGNSSVPCLSVLQSQIWFMHWPLWVLSKHPSENPTLYGIQPWFHLIDRIWISEIFLDTQRICGCSMCSGRGHCMRELETGKATFSFLMCVIGSVSTAVRCFLFLPMPQFSASVHGCAPGFVGVHRTLLL